ncbi:hypothetical protein AYO44_11790 [Planctomycetaceae bacterium SCGC AG-212-F19]|nr:hypothetical protein AYO44_11790 [Planctomycetaceae bacterium SCGC AG-212-F19]
MTVLRTLLVAVALPTLSILGTVSNVRAQQVIVFDGDTYAAIAYSPSTGKYGYASNYGSRWSAQNAALRNCPVADAKIVTWVHNGFCALALGDDVSAWGIGYSYGDGATNTNAKQRALNECSKRSNGARIVVCVCSVGR